MALSQCIEDSPGCLFPKKGNDLNFQELYNERHRLALEELVSRGSDGFLDFLKKERIPNFLSDDEIQQITRAAKVPRCASVHGDDTIFEQSASTSMDCSSVTYFPEISDIEPPLLEIGWPAFTAGSYRGVTRAVAHFQPSYGECIYSCKEAARRMIKSAREVIAIVTDSMTDLDIFKDLQEACVQRKVPVYILLDQSSAPAFLKMCSNTNVRLDDLRLMRVRTITGTTYFMRSGARITGKVHERFMLIDGNRAATGSYRFNWTDGKLNSSNLIELSGQITENFDEEFRILYAQSLPLNTRGPPSARNSGTFDHLLIRQAQKTMTSSPCSTREGPAEPFRLTSTPNRKPCAPQGPPAGEPLPGGAVCKSNPASDSSTIGDEWTEHQQLQQLQVLAGSTPQCFPTETQAVVEHVAPIASSCHVSTQTEGSMVDGDTQTESESLPQCASPQHTNIFPVKPTQNQAVPPGSSSSFPRPRFPSKKGTGRASPIHPGSAAPEANLRDCFHKLTKERQCHYSTIRTKLDYMASVLSQRRELMDVTNMTMGPGTHRRQRTQNECGQGQNSSLLVESVGMGTWPRARCLH